jgi:glycosidase
MKRTALLAATVMFSLLNSKALGADISRVEPLCWWTGMKTPLQLMFYGNDLAGASVRCLEPGLKVTAVHDAASAGYLFVDVAVEGDPGVYTFEFTKGSRKWRYPYTILARGKGSAQRVGFGPEDAIYLLMPDRFANGDPSNDSIKGLPDKARRRNRDGRHGGDIQGIIDRLDYIRDLGMTALWSTPLLFDNEPRVSYHGYACADYYHIDPRYGTNDLYRTMVDECHKRGIKVIMDIVTNHCGTAHPWNDDPPFPDWINRFDEFTRTNHAMNSPADTHAAPSERQLFETGWFDTSMPDLNLNNPFVFQYFRQWAVWWTEWAGLDGLRVDTFPYNAREPMARWTASLLEEYPNLNIVGECWYPTPALVSYWEGARTQHDGYRSCLPSVMDFPLMTAIGEALSKDGIVWGEGLKRVYDVVSQDFVYAAPERLMIMASNHDTDHLMNILGGQPDKVMLAFTILATMRGTPQFWAGDEVLIAGDSRGGDGAKRVDFPGGWRGDTLDLFDPAQRRAEQQRVWAHLSRLLNWRKNSDAVRQGRLLHYMPRHPDNVYVYFRHTETERIMVVVNGSGEQRQIEWGLYADGVAKCTAGVDILTGAKITVGEPISVPALGSMVIELF